MKYSVCFVLLGLSLVSVTVAEEGDIIIVFKKDVAGKSSRGKPLPPEVAGIVDRYGSEGQRRGKSRAEQRIAQIGSFLSLTITPRSQADVEAIRRRPGVAYVEEDGPVYADNGSKSKSSDVVGVDGGPGSNDGTLKLPFK